MGFFIFFISRKLRLHRSQNSMLICIQFQNKGLLIFGAEVGMSQSGVGNPRVGIVCSPFLSFCLGGLLRFFLFETGSHLCNLGCPRTHYANQAGLELIKVCLSLWSAGIKGWCYHAGVILLRCLPDNRWLWWYCKEKDGAFLLRATVWVDGADWLCFQDCTFDLSPY